MDKVEWEPGLRDFLPDFSSLDQQVGFHSILILSLDRLVKIFIRNAHIK